jgi:hypothetical protein
MEGVVLISIFYGTVIVFAVGSFLALPWIWFHTGHISRKLDKIITLLEPRHETIKPKQEGAISKVNTEGLLRLKDEDRFTGNPPFTKTCVSCKIFYDETWRKCYKCNKPLTKNQT